MASKEDRYAENLAGAFYVDDQCIDCDACRDCAPDFFRRHDEGGYSYVDALDGCPVEAIGDDGED
jgi:ferredoxin